VTVELNFEKKFTMGMEWNGGAAVYYVCESVSDKSGGHFLFRRRPRDCKRDRDCHCPKKQGPN